MTTTQTERSATALLGSALPTIVAQRSSIDIALSAQAALALET